MHQVPAMLAMWQSLYSHKKKNDQKKMRRIERGVRKEEGYRALLSATGSPKELPRRAKAGETPLVVASLRSHLRRARQSRHAPLTHTTCHHAHAHTLAHTHRAAVASVRLLHACCDDDGRVSLAPYSAATAIFQQSAAALLFSLSLFAGTTPSTHTQPLSRLHQTLYIKRHPSTACIGKRDRNLHSARM